ncbi:hypothetical protein SBA3_1090030 [Candidatus Sulfopaludibacter sp. SbA3]|nr:hypothetical protein SBA3_1090030 [Candidatus Sulfopaludibacter sp. SbA3]
MISAEGKITGYTIGHDMSSRDIEGENPLYLTQAKVYDRSCALGPAILVADGPLPPTTAIRLEIRRAEEMAFADFTTPASLKRRPEELVELSLSRNQLPEWMHSPDGHWYRSSGCVHAAAGRRDRDLNRRHRRTAQLGAVMAW